MKEENLTLFENLEMDNPDALKEKVRVNNLQDNLIFLMDKKKVSLADVQRETMIPWSSLYGWYTGDGVVYVTYSICGSPIYAPSVLKSS